MKRTVVPVDSNVVLRWLLGLLVLGALMGAAVTDANGAGQHNLEKTLRDYQARYHQIYAVNGDSTKYVIWPACRHRPAPPFPKDEFYGDPEQDPEMGVTVVKALFDAFYSSQDSIFGNFVKTTDGRADVEGQTSISYYSIQDFNAPVTNSSSITTTNYIGVLRKLRLYVQMLQFVTLQVQEIDSDSTTNGILRKTSNGFQKATKQLAETAMQNMWATNVWSNQSYGTSWDNIGQFEFVENTNGQFNVFAQGTRSRYTMGLNGLSGTVNILAILGKGAAAELKQNPFSSDSTNLGKYVLVESQIAAGVFISKPIATDVPVITAGSPPMGTSIGREWRLTSAIGLFKPDYEFSPDEVDCCGAGCAGNCSPGGSAGGGGSSGGGGAGSGFGGTKGGTAGGSPSGGTPPGWTPSFSIDLGSIDGENSAGQVTMNEPGTGSRGSSINGLQAQTAPGVFVATNSGQLKQIVSPATTNASLILNFTAQTSGYRIDFYKGSALGSSNSSTGTYGVTGAAFKTISVTNTSSSATNYNGLSIGVAEGGKTLISDWQWTTNSTTGEIGWQRTRRNASVTFDKRSVLRKVQTTTEGSINYQERVDRLLVQDAAGITNSMLSCTYRHFPWGESLLKLVRNPISGADDSTNSFVQTTVFSYHTNSTNTDTYGLLKQITLPTGKWMKFSEYDSQGLSKKKVSQFLNNTDSTSDFTNQVTTFDYLNGIRKVLTETKLGTNTLSRSYYQNDVSGAVRTVKQILCTTAGAQDTDTSNLTTVTTSHYNNSRDGSPIWVTYPNGTVDAYSYSTNGGTNAVVIQKSGAAAYGGGVWYFSEGVTTETEFDRLGRLFKVETTDIASSQLTHRETYAHPDENTEVITYLNGRSVTRQYGCCGIESELSMDGATTTFAYDELKRPIVTTSLTDGVATLTTYDAAGRTSKVIRQGTNSSIIILSENVYNNADEQVQSWFQRSETNTDSLPKVTYKRELVTGAGLKITSGQPVTGTNVAGTIVTKSETYNQDGTLWKIEGAAAHPIEYSYGVDSDGYFKKEIRIGETNAVTEWVKQYFDMAGRVKKVVYPDSATEAFYYSSTGLTKRIDADGVVTLYAPNALGEVAVTALDTNQNGTIDYGGNDPIVKVIKGVSSSGTYATNAVVRIQTVAYTTQGSTATNVIKSAEISVDGLKSWLTVGGNLSGRTETVYTTEGGITVRIEKQYAADESRTESRYESGRLVRTKGIDKDGSVFGDRSYFYNDAHGRVGTWVDAGKDSSDNRTNTLTYDANDRILTATTAPPDAAQSAQTTAYSYDLYGRVKQVQMPDGQTTGATYYETGEINELYGARTYPVKYKYDPQGRMRTMTTWRNKAAGASLNGEAVTTWTYDSARGYLKEKLYPAVGQTQESVQYQEYSPAGRLKKRLNGTGMFVTYGYDLIGRMISVTNSPSSGGFVSPPVANLEFDRMGRLTKIVQGDITLNRAYDNAGRMTNESYSGGPLNGFSLAKKYDASSRLDDVTVKLGGTNSVAVDYGYDSTTSRLRRVTLGSGTAQYDYATNLPLVERITFSESGVGHALTQKAYDKLNRLISIEHAVMPNYTNVQPIAGPGAPSRLMTYSYQYNSANQRTQWDVKPQAIGTSNWWGGSPISRTNAWQYGYDSLGQLASAKRFFSLGGSPERVAGQQFEYEMDDIGNRRRSKFGGDSTGSALREIGYGSGGESHANAVNQQAGRDVPGVVNISGEGYEPMYLNNSKDGILYQQGYFWKELVYDNTNHALYVPITVRQNAAGNLVPQGNSLGADSYAGFKFIPAKSPNIQPTYDASGNVAADDRWSYQWDSDGRLVSTITRADILDSTSPFYVPNLPDVRMTFVYDFFGRRIGKQTYRNLGGTNVLIDERRFVYDGWNLIAEYNGSNILLRSYAWGLDMSGSLQGAGGVGGLLLVYQHASLGGGSTVHNKPYFVHHDGNGNVIALLDGVMGQPAAWYEYGPFGEPIRMNGSMAVLNPFRFANKYTDNESGMVYYGLRYYDSGRGRWLSRDPLGEAGGLNLYGMVGNDPVNAYDPLGLASAGSPGNAISLSVPGDPKQRLEYPSWDFYYNPQPYVPGPPSVMPVLLFVGNCGKVVTGGVLLFAPDPSLLTKLGGTALILDGADGLRAQFAKDSTVYEKVVVAISGDPNYDPSASMLIKELGMLPMMSIAGSPNVIKLTGPQTISMLRQLASQGKISQSVVADLKPGLPNSATCCATKPGEHIALGMRINRLRDFAQQIGAKHLLDAPEHLWKSEFLKLLADPSTKFSLNMKGFFGNSVKEMIENEIKFGVNTGWELQQLQQAGKLGEVKLYLDGQLVVNPFAR